MRIRFLPWALAALLIAAATAPAEEVLISVRDVPSDGLVAGAVDLTGAAAWCKLGPVEPAAIRATTADGGVTVPIEFVPGDGFDPTRRVVGTLIARLPRGGDRLLRLKFDGAVPEFKPFDGTVTTPSYVIKHDAKRLGGLPWSIGFAGSEKVFETLRWADRLYHRELGSFTLAGDAEARVERVAAGPLCTVVRARSRYIRGKDRWPDAKPEAVYDWYYFHDRPLVYVTAAIRQAEPFAWHEVHFLELTTLADDFLHWAGGEPLEQGAFEGTVKTISLPDWGALVEGRRAIGMFRCGKPLIYDNIKHHGTYLQACGNLAWHGWSDTRLDRTAWLWIGCGDHPAEAVRTAACGSVPTDARLSVLVDKVRQEIDALRKQVAGLPDTQRHAVWWRLAAAEQFEAGGQYRQAVDAAGGKLPPEWTAVAAGDLGMILQRTADGLRVPILCDVARGRQLAATDAAALFRVTLRHAKTKEETTLVADAGWQKVEVITPTPSSVEIRWAGPADTQLGQLRVTARAVPDAKAGAFRWTLAVEQVAPPWSVWRVVFPQVAAADAGSGTEVFYPRAAGQVEREFAQRGVKHSGTYPSGWTSMPFMAAYDAAERGGLYVAMHDPWGSTKEIVAEGRPSDRSVLFSIDHPAADMGVAGNGFKLPGEAVWRLLRGDWFDAAVIYRDWVRAHARWYPKLGPDGRQDTPRWMRELPAWALSGGAPQACEKAVAEMQKSLGVPIGFHWYSWHQIPFDNDYPHYFPTKPGFAEAVARLQAEGVYVMPYINGRLWDTHDRGTEDFEFTRLARPAATKDEKGEPYLESYSSKESDGQRVRLAAMCPSTKLWQEKLRQIVLRLMNECGVKGVYIDQVAAAKPRLCFDSGHGHPLGGGHWWTESYWKLLEAIRSQMPKDRMLTTECNGEAYIRLFDGYLTWHWQYDGQVPAFAAVYGGAIQMFGRAYRGGPTKELALRMKAGQQLVYGEQVGWLNPGQLTSKEAFDFFRPVVQLRWQLRRYFHAGEMARPPKLLGEIPRLTADWQWSGVWPVTTDAVMAGAWRLPAQKKLVLLFANVGDEPVTARVEYDATEYGFVGPQVKVTKIIPDAAADSFQSPPKIARDVTFPPRAVWAWEVTEP